MRPVYVCGRCGIEKRAHDAVHVVGKLCTDCQETLRWEEYNPDLIMEMRDAGHSTAAIAKARGIAPKTAARILAAFENEE